MVFGFDLDGVLYNWHLLAWKWAMNVLKEDISYYEFWRYPGGYVASHEGSVFIDNMCLNEELYSCESLSDSFLKTLLYISEHSKNLIYVTYRGDWLRFATQLWATYSNLPHSNNIIYARNYGGKAKVLKSYNCDYFVEDRPHHIEELKKVVQLFVVSKPYNEHLDLSDCFVIRDITEIPTILRKEGIINDKDI